MKRLRLRIFTLVPLFFVSACSNLAWEKQGAGTGETSQALNDCRRIAEFNSYQLGPQSALGTPNVIMTPTGPTTTFQPPGAVPYPDPLLVQQYTHDCMTQKGFALVERR